MKKFLPLLLLVSLMGCVESSSLEAVFNNLPQVQSFLSEHSDAEVVFTFWTADEINASMSDIEEQCGKTIIVQDMYFARVSEDDYELIAWFDSNYNPLCVVRKQSFSEESLTVTNTSPEIIDDELELVLEYGLVEGCVKLKWTPYPESDLKYYKVVRSTTNPEPKYPEDGYISVITSRLENKYVDCEYDEGTNYYGITMVTSEHGKKYTNPVEVFMETEHEPEEVSEPVVELFGIEKDSGCVVLEWESNIKNLQYYKVVRSTTNPEPKYPEDGYIQATQGYRFEDCSLNKSSVNYYRITAVLSDSSKVHSNIVVID